MRPLILLCTMLSVGIANLDPPVLNLYNTFTAQFRLHSWNGQELKTLDKIEGTMLMDTERNKAMIHGTMDMAPIGETEFGMLIDFGEGFALTSIPTIHTC